MQISYPTCRSLSFDAHTNRLKPNNCRSPAIRHLNYIWRWREHENTTIPQTCEVASGFGLFAMDRRLESGVHIDMNPGAPSFYFFI